MRFARNDRGAAVLVLLLAGGLVRADEPSRLGRLFRFGGNTSPDTVAHGPDSAPTPALTAPSTGPANAHLGAPASGTPAPARLVPQPRNSKPVTESDPLVTRVSLGRSDDGRQFGMFLQVFADGTVIDSEGTHALGREAVKPIVDALSQGDVYRVRGHCGGPPTDFIELVHLVVYERSLGRLRANAFSLSGNAQGCDHAVRHLQTKLDELQVKIAKPATRGPSAPGLAPVNPAPSTAPTIRLNADPE